MNTKRQIEIFSAGRPLCKETIRMVQNIACQSCEISILDMNEKDVEVRAKALGIKSVPAVVIDGKLSECCSNKGPNEELLQEAGIGQPLS